MMREPVTYTADSRPDRRKRVHSLLVAASIGLGACASAPQEPASAFSPATGSSSPGPSAEQGRARDPIAESFIDALVQLPGYSPRDTTLAFERRALAADPFLRALEAAVSARGYGVRKLTTIGAINTVSHVPSADVNDPSVVVHTLSFGAAQMRRSFRRLDDGRWAPAGSLFIRGVDASRVRLGDDSRLPSPTSPTVQAPVLAQAPDSVNPGVGTGIQRRAPAGSPVTVSPVPPISAERQARRAPTQPPSSNDVQVPKNVAEIGSSNYSGVFEDYDNIEELILVFDNDSRVLGPANKRKIKRALADADLSRDLFSIIGCSFGPTAIENGNELLAIGRANRVKEELIFAGVPRAQILDEGCWAGSAHQENYPARGVVLSVKRARG